MIILIREYEGLTLLQDEIAPNGARTRDLGVPFN